MSERIDLVIDRLRQVWLDAGLEPLPGPRDSIEQVLGDIAAVLAPRRLPDEIVTFWRRLAPEYLETLSPFPPPTSPEFALYCWLEHEKGRRTTPASLFPIAYQNHCYTFVELADDDGPGGALFDWSSTGPGFRLTHPDLSSYLDQLTTMIELGEYIELELNDRDWYEFDPLEQWAQIAAVRLVPAMPLPRYGTEVRIGSDISEWPQHWLEASGLTGELEFPEHPHGADTTIAELLAAAASGVESHGTIHGEVSRCAGTPAGRRLTVHDGTGQLDVWCPSAVNAHLDSARVLEFEVVLRPRPSGSPKVEPMRGGQDTETDLYAALFDSPADAIATAVRPVG